MKLLRATRLLLAAALVTQSLAKFTIWSIPGTYHLELGAQSCPPAVSVDRMARLNFSATPGCTPAHTMELFRSLENRGNALSEFMRTDPGTLRPEFGSFMIATDSHEISCPPVANRGKFLLPGPYVANFFMPSRNITVDFTKIFAVAAQPSPDADPHHADPHDTKHETPHAAREAHIEIVMSGPVHHDEANDHKKTKHAATHSGSSKHHAVKKDSHGENEHHGPEDSDAHNGASKHHAVKKDGHGEKEHHSHEGPHSSSTPHAAHNTTAKHSPSHHTTEKNHTTDPAHGKDTHNESSPASGGKHGHTSHGESSLVESTPAPDALSVAEVGLLRAGDYELSASFRYLALGSQCLYAKDPPNCFPSSALVELRGGAVQRMDALQTGTEVHVGEGRFSRVIMWTHRDASSKGQFVRILSASGASLTASPGHFVYADGVAVPAAKVRPGHQVTLGDGQLSNVVSVSRVASTGLYNPQTADGNIVVDGVLSTTYTTAIDPAPAHALLAPVRAIFGEAFVLLSHYATSLVL